MIVFNLACGAGHRFEGWFSSGDDFDGQGRRGLLSCPVCGSKEVSKQLSAPRLNLSATGATGEPEERKSVALVGREQAQLLEMLRKVIESTEDVGQKFPEEARRIHYKEAAARPIRGVASQDEAKALSEEGIEVAHLPFPVIDKSQLN